MIRTRAISIGRPATTRSAVAVASPASTSLTICGTEKPCASIIDSVQPSRQEASNSSARRRSDFGPRRRRKSVVGMVSCAYSRSTPMAQDKITIYGPKGDGTYVVEFKTAAGETLAISVPSGETAVLEHFQARMPYGLVVPVTDRPPDDG